MHASLPVWSQTTSWPCHAAGTMCPGVCACTPCRKVSALIACLQTITHKAKEGLKDEARVADIVEFENAIDSIVEEMLGARKEGEEITVKVECELEEDAHDDQEAESQDQRAAAVPAEPEDDDEGMETDVSVAAPVIKDEPMDSD